MGNEFKYQIKDNKIIIEECPNDEFTYKELSYIKNFLDPNCIYSCYFCEGIKVIGPESLMAIDMIEEVHLPNSLQKISAAAFSYCINLKEINIPDNVEIIEEGAFTGCLGLENVILPNNLKMISDLCFMRCISLKNIKLPESIIAIGRNSFANCNSLASITLSNNLEIIGEKAFKECNNISNIILPPKVKSIGNESFANCNKLENIIMNEGLEKIGKVAFSQCPELKNITCPSTLTFIGDNAFLRCESLENVVLNDGLQIIEEDAFFYCSSLKEIEIPGSVKYVGEYAFRHCSNLKKIKVNEGVNKIGIVAFGNCNSLKEVLLPNSITEISEALFIDCNELEKIELPDSVQKIGVHAFCNCTNLKDVKLSEGLRKIYKYSFWNCKMLEKLDIPENIEEIGEEAFAGCINLKEIYFSNISKMKIDRSAFDGYSSLKAIYLNTSNGMEKIDTVNKVFCYNDDGLMFFYDINSYKYSFCFNNEYIKFERDYLETCKLLKNIRDKFNEKDKIKLYLWSKKRFVPSSVVVANMPLKDIDNFYINNNSYEWSKLIHSYDNLFSDTMKASFFKLCYVLGVFSESANIRDRAVKFLNENIIGKLDGYIIHSKFDGLDLHNGFNEEYAEFFMKYYRDAGFMVDKEGEYMIIDLTSASYNNFTQVKKVYPNKTVHTNRDADLLLPIHVVNAIKIKTYENVERGNEEFSFTVGKYGYTQDQFEKLQSWYNEGKAIKEMELFSNEDKEEKGITYSLLSKDDPLNAVLGNITNCCQVIGGAGESCVKYGMTKPNSGFITFNYKDKIIGQAWVWYDKNTKTICLDNIEVPRRYLEKISQNKNIQKSFIECLLRIEENFKKEMNRKGFKVDKVTIGRGYNDLKEILDKNFVTIENCSNLSDYHGYSDAGYQYLISKNRKR